MEDSVKQRQTTEAFEFKAKALRNPLFSEYTIFYLCVCNIAACVLFVPGFASIDNAANIFANLLPLLIVTIGQSFALIAGGIDLSAPSTIALSSVIGAMVMSGDGGLLGGTAWATPAGVAAMLLTGAMVGLLNGAAITRFRMPAFMVTLTTMMFFSGLAVWMTKSRTIYNLPPSFNALGKGFWSSLLVVGAVSAAAHFALSRTIIGRWLYAIGNNSKAAEISGARIYSTITLAYIVSGVCAAVAAILLTGRMETGSPVMGQRILLDVIGAAVIGGASIYGGKGKILLIIGGVLFITLIDNSLNMLGFSHFIIMMVKGGVILLAAFIDTVKTRLAG